MKLLEQLAVRFLRWRGWIIPGQIVVKGKIERRKGWIFSSNHTYWDGSNKKGK